MAWKFASVLRSPSFYGRLTDTEVVVNDANILHNCMPGFAQFQRVIFAWNSDKDLDSQTNATTENAFTTLMHDPHNRCCGVGVWRSSCDSVWLHRSLGGDWRCGESLDAGKTFLSSTQLGGTTPPVHGWCDGDGIELMDVVCVDHAVWTGLVINHVQSCLTAGFHKTMQTKAKSGTTAATKAPSKKETITLAKPATDIGCNRFAMVVISNVRKLFHQYTFDWIATDMQDARNDYNQSTNICIEAFGHLIHSALITEYTSLDHPDYRMRTQIQYPFGYTTSLTELMEAPRKCVALLWALFGNTPHRQGSPMFYFEHANYNRLPPKFLKELHWHCCLPYPICKALINVHTGAILPPSDSSANHEANTAFKFLLDLPMPQYESTLREKVIFERKKRIGTRERVSS